MPRISHGETPSLERLAQAQQGTRQVNRDLKVPFEFAVIQEPSPFGYLFPELQTPETLLPTSRQIRDGLVNLGVTMVEPEDDSTPDSATPSAYTYFGQFLDHDITFEAKSDSLANLSDPNLEPLPLEAVADKLKNGRTPSLDLDSVYYKPAPRLGSRLGLGVVSPRGNRPPHKDIANDLPRQPPRRDPETDRAALIGDFRNDENLIIARLHVAFLRAHNAVAVAGRSFDETRKLLRRHYQWIVVKDFLNRIADPEIVQNVLNKGNRFFRPGVDQLFMPLEFSVAAYRYGHSMIRSSYNYNLNFRGPSAATLKDLFSLTAVSGRLGGFDTLPEAWIIEWPNFLDEGTNHARRIDTRLTKELFELQAFGKPMPNEARLPVRNLLRGYLLRLPTGQAVARALGVPVMKPREIEAVAATVSEKQLAAVRACRFSERTPLWYYVLAEAAHRMSSVLGPVGSTIVSEVLIGLVRNSKDSILRGRNWTPTLGTMHGRFTLRDLLKLGGVI